MSRKETKDFPGGFDPLELKTNKPRGRTETTLDWQGLSDREESLFEQEVAQVTHKQRKTNEKPEVTNIMHLNRVGGRPDARELIPKTKVQIPKNNSDRKK